MSSVTVVLAVFIMTLAAGNIFLFYMKKTKKQTVFDAIKAQAGPVTREENIGVSENPVVANKKIELAHMRIHGVEKEVRAMRSKVEKLDNFRPTIEAEIIGLKEAVDDLKSWTANGGKLKKVSKPLEKDISTEEMRKLIYKASN